MNMPCFIKRCGAPVAGIEYNNITWLPALREKEIIWQEKANTVRDRKRRIIPSWGIAQRITARKYPSEVRRINRRLTPGGVQQRLQSINILKSSNFFEVKIYENQNKKHY